MKAVVINRGALEGMLDHLVEEEDAVKRYGSMARLVDLVENEMDRMDYQDEIADLFVEQLKGVLNDL